MSISYEICLKAVVFHFKTAHIYENQNPVINRKVHGFVSTFHIVSGVVRSFHNT